jgi:hypothetical protein
MAWRGCRRSAVGSSSPTRGAVPRSGALEAAVSIRAPVRAPGGGVGPCSGPRFRSAPRPAVLNSPGVFARRCAPGIGYRYGSQPPLATSDTDRQGIWVPLRQGIPQSFLKEYASGESDPVPAVKERVDRHPVSSYNRSRQRAVTRSERARMPARGRSRIRRRRRVERGHPPLRSSSAAGPGFGGRAAAMEPGSGRGDWNPCRTRCHASYRERSGGGRFRPPPARS